jgi:RNase P subunit RPR2
LTTEEFSQSNNTVATSCKSCGAPMVYKPGTNLLVCTYCNSTQEIKQEDLTLNEIDFLSFINSYEKEEFNKTKVVTCTNCKATPTVNENLRSMMCPYCGSPLVEDNIHEERFIKPEYVLPFGINRNNVNDILKKWVDGFWFAPDNLKKSILSTNNLNGIYVPFWTFDTITHTDYKGEQGEAYSETVGSGENRRTVRRVDWTYTEGSVENFYDDILVCGSGSLRSDILQKIQHGWNPKAVVKIDNNYLEGFITEKYQIDLKESYEQAKVIFNNYERESVRRAIGGDEQRIHDMYTKFNNITFKHILVPIYVSSFVYNNKNFTFYINGITGSISGDRPYSNTKIVFACLFAFILIVILLMIMR